MIVFARRPSGAAKDPTCCRCGATGRPRDWGVRPAGCGECIDVGSVDERVILAIGDSADANAQRPKGDQAGTNMLMCLLGTASVRLDVWGGYHGGAKSSGVGLW